MCLNLNVNQDSLRDVIIRPKVLLFFTWKGHLLNELYAFKWTIYMK